MSEIDPRTEDLENVYDDATETGDTDIEAPDADAAEQRASVGEDDRGRLSRVPYDVDEADAADQERAVEFDDDDYR